MKETLADFFKDLFESEAFRNALITVITTLVLILSVKLQAYLQQITEKAKLQKLNTLRSYAGTVSRDLIINAEKRFVEDDGLGKDKEAWVVDMLKFQFKDYVDSKELTDDDIKSIVRKNYETLRTEIPEERWEKMASEVAEPKDMKSSSLKGTSSTKSKSKS